MARTALAVTDISRVGTDIDAALTASPANADGEEVANGGDVVLIVRNGDAGSHTVTITTPRTVDGLAVAEYTQVVAAGEIQMFGPFPPVTFNDQSNGMMDVDFDDVTSVEIIAVRI